MVSDFDFYSIFIYIVENKKTNSALYTVRTLKQKKSICYLLKIVFAGVTVNMT